MIGFGYDSHRFSDKGKLYIGGIEIPADFGVIAHSDGDVLIHALIDALLGAAGLGDIGTLYPDTDAKYKDISSSVLLKETMNIINNRYVILNIDATIVLEKPKLISYKEQIRTNIAKLCSIHEDRVNIKAKTNEKMGFVGRSEGIQCYVACQIDLINN